MREMSDLDILREAGRLAHNAWVDGWISEQALRALRVILVVIEGRINLRSFEHGTCKSDD